MEKSVKNNNKLREEREVRFDSIITCSKEMLRVLDIAKRISQSETSVLLVGVSGTGKELMARAIHNNSFKKDGPFVVVNCAGIPDTLIESELFGHEKGAFTDAISKKKGKFELAHGGTLFLDEIGDLSLFAQPKTLRAVEDKKFMRLGGEEPISVNCRIIAATNKDLPGEVKKGQFREDLYYRLCEIRLDLPPLAQRKADIPMLVDYFIKEFNREFGKNVIGASNIVLSYLMKYHWPGNVRELRSIIKIGMALVSRDTLWLEDLPFKIELAEKEYIDLGSDDFPLDEAEKKHILRVLKYSKWNKSKAAKLLKISRPTLDRKIEKYDLDSGPKP
jgi:transcriptional regulator with PAS, ATPase and Fis domain